MDKCERCGDDEGMRAPKICMKCFLLFFSGEAPEQHSKGEDE